VKLHLHPGCEIVKLAFYVKFTLFCNLTHVNGVEKHYDAKEYWQEIFIHIEQGKENFRLSQNVLRPYSQHINSEPGRTPDLSKRSIYIFR
jgi:hypothetical protein